MRTFQLAGMVFEQRKWILRMHQTWVQRLFSAHRVICVRMSPITLQMFMRCIRRWSTMPFFINNCYGKIYRKSAWGIFIG